MRREGRRGEEIGRRDRGVGVRRRGRNTSDINAVILGITEGSVMEVRKSLVITPPLLREPCVSHGHLRVFTKASLMCVEGNIYVSKGIKREREGR